MHQNGHPAQVAVFSQRPIFPTGPSTLLAIKYNGAIHQLADPDAPTVERNNGHLIINGEPYIYYRPGQCRLRGIPGGKIEQRLDHYTRLAGWVAMLHYPGDKPCPWPRKAPSPDRAAAEAYARTEATSYLGTFQEHVRIDVVYQRGDTYSEPVARIDTTAYTSAEALALKLKGETLPLEYVDEEDPQPGEPPGETKKGAAATAPHAESGHPVADSSTTHSNTDTAKSQKHEQDTVILTVKYISAAPNVVPGKKPHAGELVEYQKNGQPATPCADSMPRIRRELHRRGYRVDYTAWHWLDKGPGPRRRRETYRLSDPDRCPEVDPTVNNVQLAALKAGLEPMPEVTEEDRARWRAQGQAGQDRPNWYRQNVRAGQRWDMVMGGIA